MNSLLDDDDEPSGQDHELTLSTGAILGIFLGLALLCGLFFGFGYKMGSHKTQSPQAATAPASAVAPAANFSNFKPAAGSPANSAGPSIPVQPPTPAPAAETPPKAPTTVAPIVRPTPTSPAQTGATTPVATGIFVVQVAAVSRQEDADLLVHALTVKGYSAFQRNEPQDKLLHIQVGPFTTRKDADAAKQRLLGDGYQPIVK
jgi:DedD protein